MTEQKQPEALRLIAEWRSSMPIGVMRIWAADVRDELRRQHAEIESLRAKLDALEKQEPVEIDWPDYHSQGMGCGLEDRGIRDRYEAMRHGWDQAIECVAECLPEKLYLAAGARPVGVATMPQWVPIGKGLPNDETPVLVLRHGFVRIGERRWDHPGHEDTYQSYWYWDDPVNDGQCWERDEITHWQPLPAPAAQADADAQPSTCTWSLDDEDSSTWSSSCGELWSFIDGGPKENRVKYCHHCGKPVDVARAADIFGDAPQPSQEPPPLKPMCCRCLDESDDLLPANCSEKPELLTGAPLGMYHCPDCGAMVCAGFPHGPLCQTCHDRKHTGFDCDHTSAANKKEPI